MYFNNQGQRSGNAHGGGGGQAQNPFNFMGQGSDFFQGFQNFQNQFGPVNFGGQPGGMNDQNVHYSQQTSSNINGGGRQRGGHNYPGESRHSGAIDNSIDISNHSVSMTLMEPSDRVVLRGHNCKIEIGPGNTISNLLITGHNNKVFSKVPSSSSGQPQFGVIDKVEVVGHNNRVEYIIANTLKVNGHNNRFQQFMCASMQDTGICNQFHQCQNNIPRQSANMMNSNNQNRAQQNTRRTAANNAQTRQNQNQRQQPQDVGAMMGGEQDINVNHVNIAADEEDINNIGEYSSDDEQIDEQDIPDQDDLIEPSIQDDTVSNQINLEQDEDDQEHYGSSIERLQGRNRLNRFREQQRGPRLNRQVEDDDDDDEGDEEDSSENIVEHIIGNNVETDLETGTHGDDEYDTMDQEIYQHINRQARNQQNQQAQYQRQQQYNQQQQNQRRNMQQQSRPQGQRGAHPNQQANNMRSQANGAQYQGQRSHGQNGRQFNQQQNFNNQQNNQGPNAQFYNGMNQNLPQNDPNFQQFMNGAQGMGNPNMPNAQGMPGMQGMPQMNPGQNRGGNPQGNGQNPQNFFNLSGIMSDVQNMLNHLQTNSGIQMNFDGNGFQGGQRGNAQQQNFQYSTSNQGGNQQFFFNGMPAGPNGVNMPNGMGGFAAQYEYGSEYGEEEQPQLDEDGQPLRSPEEIKNIINAIPSFKYEEKKLPADSKDNETESQKQSNKETCAICLDDLQTGQMVKALACSHKFHSKCINFWLKQKLKCPLCKERIELNQYS